MLSPEEHARRTLAYHRTGNDADAATVLDVSVEVFRKWRKAHALPAKSTKKPARPNGSRPDWKLDLEEVRKLLPR